MEVRRLAIMTVEFGLFLRHIGNHHNIMTVEFGLFLRHIGDHDNIMTVEFGLSLCHIGNHHNIMTNRRDGCTILYIDCWNLIIEF